ncbi:MAG: glycosyl transferase, family 28 [Bacilli bacterium]|nr:glycosyl transferase, family 28 [Bacilli bacterium]
MNITLLTTGTLGDVRPFLALALGLQELGHQVTLAAPMNFESYLKQFPVSVHSLVGDTQQVLESDKGRRWMASGNVKEFMNALQQISHEIRYDRQRVILSACQDCELIIVHPLLLSQIATLSEKLKKPFVLATPFPIVSATREFPQFLVRAKRLPFGFLNQLTHQVFSKVWQKSDADDINEWRSKLSLEPLRGSVFRNIAQQQIPILHAYSPSIIPHPKDWGDHNFITGQLKMNDKYTHEHAKEKLNDDLAEWLERGQAPIYFGFGSLPVLEPQKMIDMVLDITQSLNTRAILASGWSNMTAGGTPLPDSVFMIKSADHVSLFPRCSCVIHHGGAGTTHTALESGTPSIICSTYGDQPFWGERITELNIGRHIPFPKLTKENLTRAIQELQNESVRDKAAEMGKRIKAENGVQNALDWLEKRLPTLPTYMN